ncbi:ArsR/SmtB family transcription factor [Devosia sediminis]|uniref:Helix-turn-helix transcriptional regulator n=1 Tax=Devosia sediminis TaxID=2798801 RepID=A0A934J0T6_9HYPH|nr:helix-turn-helix domain-containing protein [Devosia sediminis]MBJ3786715.1 helix-turn-helix transcriptional regulator [Devosia sediminis]
MAGTEQTALIEDADRALLALSPVKRRLLEALREPGSAASLAKRLDMPRQQLGYHLRALEAAGLVRLVEERRRRGFTERVLVAAAGAFVLDPALLGGARHAAQDRHAAEHLVEAAGTVVREVTRMRGAAEAAGQRLLTLTMEAELGFERPQDFEDFAKALGEAVAEVATRYRPGQGKKGYHLMLGVHPAVAGTSTKPIN